MYIKISSLLVRLAVVAKLGPTFHQSVKGAAKQLEGYFSLGFEYDVYEDVNFENLLWSTLTTTGMDDREADAVLDGAVAYLMSKETQLKKREHKVEDAGTPAEKLWREGTGYDIEGRLRAKLKGILSQRKLATPEEMEGILDKMLLPNRARSPRVTEILRKVKGDITRHLAAEVKNKLGFGKQVALKELGRMEPEEVLEGKGGPEGEGVKKKDVDKAWRNPLGVDIEKIDEFVRGGIPADKLEGRAKAEWMVFDNVVSKDPATDKDLVKSIKDATGLDVTSATVGNWRKGLMTRIKDKFFPEPKVKTEEGAAKSIKGLTEGQLKSFKSFIKDRGEGGKYSRETLDKVLTLVDGLAAGQKVKDIAEDSGIKKELLWHYSAHVVPELYEWWMKAEGKDLPEELQEGQTEGEKKMGRLIEAMERLSVGSVAGAVRFLAGVLTSEEKGDAPKADPEKVPEKERIKDPEEAALAGMASKIVEEKKKAMEKFKKLVEKRILSKHDFDVLIIFDSDYDWSDVSHGKVKMPEQDEDGNWEKGDPHFGWVSWTARIKRDMSVGKSVWHVDYLYNQPLTDNGAVSGDPEASLEVLKDGEEGIAKSDRAFFRAFFDEYMTNLLKSEGLEPSASANLSVKYKNKKADRTYKNIEDFQEMMGWLSFSDPVHQDRVKKHKEWLRKKEEFHRGTRSVGLPGERFNPAEAKAELKAIVKKPHVPDKDKKQAEKYLEDLKGEVSKEQKKEITDFLEGHYKSEYERQDPSGLEIHY